MSRQMKYFGLGILLFCAAAISATIQLPTFFVAIVSFSSAISIYRGTTKAAGTNSPIGLYLFFGILYTFTSSLNFFGFAENYPLDPFVMNELLVLGNLFLLGAGMGCMLLERTPLRTFTPNVGAEAIGAGIMTCTLLFLGCVALTISLYGFSIGTISRSDLYLEQRTALTITRGAFASAIGATAALLVAHESTARRRVTGYRALLLATLIIYSLLDLLILGDRRIVLAAALGVGTVLIDKDYTRRTIIFGFLLFAILFIYGFVRNTPPENWIYIIFSGQIFDSFNPVSTEFGTIYIFGSAIGNLNNPPGFPNYFDGLIQLMPKFFIGQRPAAPTEWFAQTYYPDLAAIGGSFAFNQIIEARLNLGNAGVALIGLMTGLLISITSRYSYAGVAIGLPLAVNVFCFSMRMDMVSIVRTAVIACAGTALILFSASLARKKTA